MTPQLFSVDHAPRMLPAWQLMIEDLSKPPAPRLARVLGVGVRTVYRWNAAGSAPRTACLAVFWLTRWGRSAVNTQAVNDALVACGYVSSLEREIHRLESNIRHLVALNNGAANTPLLKGPR